MVGASGRARAWLTVDGVGEDGVADRGELGVAGGAGLVRGADDREDCGAGGALLHVRHGVHELLRVAGVGDADHGVVARHAAEVAVHPLGRLRGIEPRSAAEGQRDWAGERNSGGGRGEALRGRSGPGFPST